MAKISRSVKDDLQDLLDKSKEVEVSEYETIPDGLYDVDIVNMDIYESENSGNIVLKWEFEIVEGEQEGRKHWKYNALNSAENMKRATTELEKFGVDTSSLASIEKGLKDMIDVPAVIEVKTTTSKKNGQSYTNTRVKPLDD